MQKIISVIGILVVMIGTIFSLWSIITTKTKNVGTAQYFDNQQEYFRKDKKKVIIGAILIFVGSIMQILGTIL